MKFASEINLLNRHKNSLATAGIRITSDSRSATNWEWGKGTEPLHGEWKFSVLLNCWRWHFLGKACMQTGSATPSVHQKSVHFRSAFREAGKMRTSEPHVCNEFQKNSVHLCTTHYLHCTSWWWATSDAIRSFRWQPKEMRFRCSLECIQIGWNECRIRNLLKIWQHLRCLDRNNKHWTSEHPQTSQNCQLTCQQNILCTHFPT